jgi:hypothetical protein
MNGWLAVNSRPSDRRRVDAAWSTVYWEFVQRYAEERFGTAWAASAETSIALWAENWSISPQIVIRSPEANNQAVKMPSSRRSLVPRFNLSPVVFEEVDLFLSHCNVIHLGLMEIN